MVFVKNFLWLLAFMLFIAFVPSGHSVLACCYDPPDRQPVADSPSSPSAPPDMSDPPANSTPSSPPAQHNKTAQGHDEKQPDDDMVRVPAYMRDVLAARSALNEGLALRARSIVKNRLSGHSDKMEVKILQQRLDKEFGLTNHPPPLIPAPRPLPSQPVSSTRQAQLDYMSKLLQAARIYQPIE